MDDKQTFSVACDTDDSHSLGDRIFKHQLTRRDFLWLMGASSAALSVSSLTGCAVDPVTGEKGLVLMSEGQEIAVDRQYSPHQFSKDLGASQDDALNSYISSIGQKMGVQSHRPQMPYSFRAVNATYVNAYAFPGGSIAVTRGILLEMDNEAELAALLGHELGHVNARHAAEQQTKGILTQAALAGANAALRSSSYSQYAPALGMATSIGASALLASYSRDNEREADALGMEYMTRIEENPQGMVGLMQMLREQNKKEPSLLNQMFSSHPMSFERYQTAVAREGQYVQYSKLPLKRERYMDNTAKLRKIAPAIKALQKAEKLMHQEQFVDAEKELKKALKVAPNDYAALTLMGKCQMAMGKSKEARRYLDKAKTVYPGESQAVHLSGLSFLMENNYARGYDEFRRYEQKLPGNPDTLFYQAVSLEGMHKKRLAAQKYHSYLQQVNQGGQAKHAYQRLQTWGYIK